MSKLDDSQVEYFEKQAAEWRKLTAMTITDLGIIVGSRKRLLDAADATHNRLLEECIAASAAVRDASDRLQAASRALLYVAETGSSSEAVS